MQSFVHSILHLNGMYLFKTERDLQNLLQKKALRVGFVPTMGALHAGHLSLIEQSKRENDLTVCSIFVNPTQFNDPKDYEKYPITLDRDIDLLTQVGTDVLFLPTVQEMYPEGVQAKNSYDLGKLDTLLEGAFRPGHYHGVCTVVEKLLLKVLPTVLYLGAKDYQQCLVINKLVDLLQLKIKVSICPTLREPDGLAMSSRNVRLPESDRKTAPLIYQCLSYIKDQSATTPFEHLKSACLEKLAEAGFQTEYLALMNASHFEPLNDFKPNTKMVLLFAGKLGEVRLIDNIEIV